MFSKIPNNSNNKDSYSINNPRNNQNSHQISDSTKNDENDLKKLQLLLKILSLISFFPYAIAGMLYINNSVIFIPCFIMATFTIILTMFFSIKLQNQHENFNKIMNSISKSFHDFVNINMKNINHIEGIEILENSIKPESNNEFISHEFIAKSLAQGSLGIKSFSTEDDVNNEKISFDKKTDNSLNLNNANIKI